MKITLEIDNPIILKELENKENKEKKEDYLRTIMDIGSTILDNSTEIVANCKLMGPLKELLQQSEEKINGNIDDKLGSLQARQIFPSSADVNVS